MIRLVGRCKICEWEHGVAFSEAQLLGASLSHLIRYALEQSPPLTLSKSHVSYHRRHIVEVKDYQCIVVPPVRSDHGFIDGVRNLAFQVLERCDGQTGSMRATDVKLLHVAVYAILGKRYLEGVSSFDVELRGLIEAATADD